MQRSTPKKISANVHDEFSNITPILTVSKRRLGVHLQSTKKIRRQKAGNESLNGSHNKLVNDSEGLRNGVDDMFLSDDDSLFTNLPIYINQSNNLQCKDVAQCISANDQKSVESPDMFDESWIFNQPLNESIGKQAKDPPGLSGLSHLFNESFSSEIANDPPSIVARTIEKTVEPDDVILESEKNAVGYTQFHENFETSFGATPMTQCHILGPFYGMPSRVKDLIQKHKEITQLYDWQRECLALGTSREKKNLVYALPTSGGKTLVAEILLLREILCYQKTALFILPFVAIVQEKVRSLSPLAVDLGFLVEEYAAGKGTMPPRKRRRKKSILVCTIEKALAVVQSLIEVGRLHEIGLAVIDEIHLVGEGSGRGVSLEMLITFLMASSCKIHLVGMSATIGNLKEIATFLNAESYSGNFRPVELVEYVKCGNTICKVDAAGDQLFVHHRDLPSTNNGAADPDSLGVLVKEVCPAESVLVFCATKKNTENVASLLCKQLPKSMRDHKAEEKKRLLEVIAGENNGRVCPILKESIQYGVAYHHSGLTADERKLLEDAYRNSIICCICCTSTLAAGVNLPAKRVILRAPYVGRNFISLSKYKQMVGRAGRAGLGACGESILIYQINETPKVFELLQSRMDEVESQMTAETCADLITAAVGLNVANTRHSLRQFVSLTLLSVQEKRLEINIKTMTDKILSDLLKNGTLKVVSGTGGPTVAMEKNDSTLQENLEVTVPNQVVATKFKVTSSTVFTVSKVARAAMKGGISLPVAQKLRADLNAAKKNLNLQCDLHILHLITPYQVSDQVIPNRTTYFNVYMQLSDAEQQAAKAVGLSEYHMSRMAMGTYPKNIPPEVVNRFYVTLMLNELWKQRGVWEVASLFQVPRGQVQALQSAASSFCWNVMRFCEDLPDLWAIRAILSDFAPRLAYCCEEELLPLMELPAIKRARARQLFNGNFKSLQDIAKARPSELVHEVTHLSMAAASQIIAAAKLKLYEKVENLKEEVEDVMEDISIT